MIKRNLLVMGLAILLCACGFQLRGTGSTQMTLKELDLSARDAYGDTVTQLRKALQTNGVNVHSGAPYKLILTNENETQRSVSNNGSTQSAEFELTSTLNYEIEGRDHLTLLTDKLETQKTYVQDNNNLVGADSEAAQARKEMRSELIQKMLIRLQLLTPAQLAKLQQTADNKAKADADALEAARRFEATQPQQSPLQLPAK